MRMGIFTKRDIKKDEELTFNYNVDRYGWVPWRRHARLSLPGLRAYHGAVYPTVTSRRSATVEKRSARATLAAKRRRISAAWTTSTSMVRFCLAGLPCGSFKLTVFAFLSSRYR